VTEQNVPVTDPAEDLPEQMRVRRSKRERLLAAGVSPYPVQVPRTATLKDLTTGGQESLATAPLAERLTRPATPGSGEDEQ